MPDRLLYLALVVQNWDTLQPEHPRLMPPVSVKPWEGCVGFAPIFDSLEAAQREFPNSTVMQVRSVLLVRGTPPAEGG